MDYYRVLCRYYPEGHFFLSDTKDYSTLEWLYIDTPKPTKEEVEKWYEECKCELIKEDIEYEEIIKKMDSTSVVQEQQKQIETLQEQIDELKEQINKLSN
jgi:hypothetical protein